MQPAVHPDLDPAGSQHVSPGQQKAVVTPDAVVRAHVASLRLLLAGWITHFGSRGYIKDSTMDLLDRKVCKRTTDLSVRDPTVRRAIGLESKVWSELVDLFRAAMPSLEHRSYAPADPANPTYDGPSSNAIVGNSVSLLKDLQRLDNMLAIARNVLTSGDKVQNLAAQLGFDREVCAMINLCIKITARGYDGDGSAVDEDKWQGVINGFKKLLITCLQFLSNLVTLNERLKLMLWVELFDSTQDTLHAVTSPAEPPAASPPKPVDGRVKTAVDDFKQQQTPRQASDPALRRQTNDAQPPRAPRPSAFTLWAVTETARVQTALADEDDYADPDQVDAALEHKWKTMPAPDRAKWDRVHEENIDQIQKRLERFTSAAGTVTNAALQLAMYELGLFGPAKPLEDGPAAPPAAGETAEEVEDNDDESSASDRSASPEPFWKYGVMNSAADGARKLQEGKAQLLRRLEHAPAERVQQNESAAPAPPQAAQPNAPPTSAEPHASVVTGDRENELDPEDGDDGEDGDDDDDDDDADDDLEGEDESSEEEDDYAIPGEDGRGLLTDVPLILGPNEIEVLPMVIMSGIVASPGEAKPPSSAEGEADHAVNMYTIRCHLLLAQENGRNLLRELLIFVAAWDLREEELYFKFMVKIMEAILMNGLMPFAYGAFKESKDIISPAQAVIMKLLTKIFHARQGFVTAPQPGAADATKALLSPDDKPKDEQAGEAAQTYDVQIVHCLFSEFRQNIIPQICALIFLQGQIRLGHAHLEDFPLNLWDMERMYEGVYQYLEFFAILTDHEQWKQLMAEWEVTSELLTLLTELEVAIPKGRNQPPPPPPPPPETLSDAPSPAGSKSAGPVPVAVERPYDVSAAAGSSAAQAKTPSTTTQTPVDQHAGEAPASQPPLSAMAQAYTEPLHDEPADFEWRNLKKLCILVLSSLVWKSPVLQDQVRRFNGITTILACCSHDDHNPYIREHAIMCLRFLLEGNAKNQEVIKGLAEGWVDVPRSAEAAWTATWGTAGEAEAQKDAAGAAAAATGGDDMVRVRSKLAVPAEVLDQQGYETFVDAKGQVGLRRKESPSLTDKAAAAAAQVAQAHGQAAASIEEAKAVHHGGKKTGLLEPGAGNFPDWLGMVMKSASRQG